MNCLILFFVNVILVTIHYDQVNSQEFNNCGPLISEEVAACLERKNIVKYQDDAKDNKDFCCNHWKQYDCEKAAAQKICSQRDANEYIGLLDKTQSVTKTKCKSHPYGSSHCNDNNKEENEPDNSSGSSLVINLLMIISLTMIIYL